MILDDEAVETGRGVGARVPQPAFVDRLHRRISMIRRAKQRREMHDAYEDVLLTTENGFQRIVARVRHAWEIAHVRGSS